MTLYGKPMACETNGTLTACEPQWNFVFYDKDNKPVLKLSYDGKIEVYGDHDEAVQAFLSKLGEVYGGLPARLKEAEDKVKDLRRLNEGLVALCDKYKEEIEILKGCENCKRYSVRDGCGEFCLRDGTSNVDKWRAK